MMKHTPPKNNNEPISHTTSEPDLTTPQQTMDRITFRQKRKHDCEHSTELISLREEIMSSFAILRKEQTEKFCAMEKNLDLIKTQNVELQNTVEFLSDKYDDLLKKLAHLEQERKNTLGYIQVLEEKVETLERDARSSSLEIRNVPKTPGETKENLICIIKTLGNAVNTEIQPQELSDVYRLNNSRNIQTGGPITVKFASTLTKERLLINIKKYNRDNKNNKLNSTHLKIDGNIPIYVSESLTSKTKKLYYQAREFAKENDYAFHWVSHGKVYIKKKEGLPARRIDQGSDFEGLKQQKK